VSLAEHNNVVKALPSDRTNRPFGISVLPGSAAMSAGHECHHPFLAIARARHANPIILLDELEKTQAGTRADGGRLWTLLQ
jgi:hypothetical protein